MNSVKEEFTFRKSVFQI